MFDFKELIEKGIKEGIDVKSMLMIVAESLDDGKNKFSSYRKLYEQVYKTHLCDSFCKFMVDKMYNDSGHGEKWTIEEVLSVAKSAGVSFTVGNDKDDYTQHEFYAAMHMMFYDYGPVFEEQGIKADPVLYAKMADATLDDIDGKPGRLRNYFFDLHSDSME